MTMILVYQVGPKFSNKKKQLTVLLLIIKTVIAFTGARLYDRSAQHLQHSTWNQFQIFHLENDVY